MLMNIIGRLTSDAQVNITSQDKKVVNFSVAVNETYKNKKGKRITQTAFFSCSYWLSPNVANHLTKGLLVELSGMVQVSAWMGKDGEPKAGMNFHTSQIKFLSAIQKRNTANSDSNNGTSIDDDLPF